MAKTILVADDDPAIVESTKLILEEFGYNVVTTVDGETIYKMKKDFPDLLLLDIWMSGQDGRKICRYLKSEEATTHIPIIMVSASRAIRLSAKEAGADDFIAKPFEMDDLVNLIEKYVDRIILRE
jgi:CheY-like chemotaxis protein